MKQFRSLMTLALTAGVLAGLFLFALQHLTVVPIIERAEKYENAGHHEAHGEEQVCSLQKAGNGLPGPPSRQCLRASGLQPSCLDRSR